MGYIIALSFFLFSSSDTSNAKYLQEILLSNREGKYLVNILIEKGGEKYDVILKNHELKKILAKRDSTFRVDSAYVK